jgi:hypothetical protein
MKGLVFTEFVEMVEQKWGLQMVDSLISDVRPANDGAYTAVGNYPHGEMVSFVVALHKRTEIPISDLLKEYGRYLFHRLALTHGYIIAGVNDSLTLLQDIEKIIHVEVKKLYTDSMPPMFTGMRISEDELHLVYQSHRSMSDVAEGLMMGCAEHYNEKLSIEKLSSSDDGTRVEFMVKRYK